MKNIFLSLIALMATMSINAQVMKVYVNGNLTGTYVNTPTHSVDAEFIYNTEIMPAQIEDNLLPGAFSVSSTKKVQFTKSNIYWDGSDFKFEENQTDYPTTWDANHVGHFYWTTLTDYQSGNADYMPYAKSYNYSSRSMSDKFWCGEDNPLTVEGTSGLYALTEGKDHEWCYLIGQRPNASRLHKSCVTVTNGDKIYRNCLIIAPDDFAGELASNYTLDEVNAYGLVCLPAASYRYDGGLEKEYFNVNGLYWSASPSYYSVTYIYNAKNYARALCFNNCQSVRIPIYTFKEYDVDNIRSNGYSLRLVRNL